MIARGFKPVGWVAAVGTAALGCYMLSLRVASERADLTNLERRIVATRQQIRSLQTELGTRGRLQQLEQWNDEVLALAAPVSGQYLHSNVQLARFGAAPGSPLDAPAELRLAAAETAPAPAPPAAAPTPAPRHAVADARALAPPAPLERPLVQRASLTIPAATAAPAPARPQAAPAAPPRTGTVTVEPQAAATSRPPAAPARTRTASASPRPSALLDDRALREIGTAARAERGGGTRD
jgi:hypothetical protein